MKLLLTSAGFTNESIVNALRDLVDAPTTAKKVAFIPTAANVMWGDKWWYLADLAYTQKIGWKGMDVVDFSAVPMDVWYPRLMDADVIVVGGGNTFHLLYCMERFGLREKLESILKNKIYVGISAGSMIVTKNIMLSEASKMYSETIGELKDEKGLDWVDFQIRPHLNSKSFPNVTEKNLEKLAQETKDTIYAIDDETAILVDGQKLEIISQGKWKKFN